MNANDRTRVEIVEVAPRDGFQVVKEFIPTARKLEVIDALAATGIARLEIGAFVAPNAIPQMADIDEILRQGKNPRQASACKSWCQTPKAQTAPSRRASKN